MLTERTESIETNAIAATLRIVTCAGTPRTDSPDGSLQSETIYAHACHSMPAQKKAKILKPATDWSPLRAVIGLEEAAEASDEANSGSNAAQPVRKSVPYPLSCKERLRQEFSKSDVNCCTDVGAGTTLIWRVH